MATSYFGNCIGVFQGGGVRGAAFAGAYEAAREAGVAFCALAGTSAGALAASLIATGAAPELITGKLMALDFKRFLVRANPKQAFVERSALVRISGAITNRKPENLGKLGKLAAVANLGGIYNSSEVHNWVEATLRELLASQGRQVNDAQVRFRDLPIPLSVVAADLASSTYAIFSRERTPDSSVAMAARASCTIPFFFQPVFEGGTAFVDGGILANLPAFLFDSAGNGALGKYSPRILAFRLVSNAPRSSQFADVEQLAEAVANTIVDGATAIQNRLQSGHFTVTIDTGTIKATDFETVGKAEKQTLFDAGKKACEEFIRNERNAFYDRRLPTTFVGRDQQMLLLVEALTEARERFVILDKNSHWLYLTFPAFLAAARRGVNITYLTHAERDSDAQRQRHEDYRRRLLKGLGAVVLVRPHLPFTGFLIDPELETGFVALTHKRPRGGSYDAFRSEETRTYSRHLDTEVVESLLKDAGLPAKTAASTAAPDLKFNVCNPDLLFARLRTVPQYRDASFELRDVVLDGTVRATQRYVKEFKCVQIDALTRDFLRNGIEPFIPQQIALGGGMTTIITPPVLEEHGSHLILMEGHTRALHTMRSGRKTLRAVVVGGVTAHLPARPGPLMELSIASETLGLDTQYEDLSSPDWREIEGRVHPVEDGEGAA